MGIPVITTNAIGCKTQSYLEKLVYYVSQKCKVLRKSIKFLIKTKIQD